MGEVVEELYMKADQFINSLWFVRNLFLLSQYWILLLRINIIVTNIFVLQRTSCYIKSIFSVSTRGRNTMAWFHYHNNIPWFDLSPTIEL